MNRSMGRFFLHIFYILVTLCGALVAQPSVGLKNPSFDGVYVGAVVGYGAPKTKVDRKTVTTYQVVDPNQSWVLQDKTDTKTSRNQLTPKDTHGGVYAGYGKVLGKSRIYMGAEAGYFWGTAKDRYNYAPQNPAIGDVLEVQVKRMDRTEVAARIGLALNRALPYIKVGWVHTKVEASQVVVPAGPSVPGTPPDNSDPDNLIPEVPADPSQPQAPLKQPFLNKRMHGVVIGVGVDVKLTRHWIAGLEYTHTIYPKARGPLHVTNTTVNPPTIANGSRSSVSFSNHSVRFRVAFQF